MAKSRVSAKSGRVGEGSDYEGKLACEASTASFIRYVMVKIADRGSSVEVAPEHVVSWPEPTCKTRANVRMHLSSWPELLVKDLSANLWPLQFT